MKFGRLRAAAICGALVFCVSVTAARATTYALPACGLVLENCLIGSITTDGTQGALTGANIASYNLTITNLVGAPFANFVNTGLTVIGGLYALPGGLFFDFGDPAPCLCMGLNMFGSDPGHVYFATGVQSPINGPNLNYNFIIQTTFSQREWIGGLAEIASETPLPAALPLFATGLGALGLLGWRRKRTCKSRD